MELDLFYKKLKAIAPSKALDQKSFANLPAKDKKNLLDLICFMIKEKLRFEANNVTLEAGQSPEMQKELNVLTKYYHDSLDPDVKLDDQILQSIKTFFRNQDAKHQQSVLEVIKRKEQMGLQPTPFELNRKSMINLLQQANKILLDISKELKANAEDEKESLTALHKILANVRLNEYERLRAIIQFIEKPSSPVAKNQGNSKLFQPQKGSFEKLKQLLDKANVNTLLDEPSSTLNPGESKGLKL